MVRGSSILGENADDYFGLSVDITPDGNTLVVGSIGNDDGGTLAGEVSVFDWDGTLADSMPAKFLRCRDNLVRGLCLTSVGAGRRINSRLTDQTTF